MSLKQNDEEKKMKKKKGEGGGCLNGFKFGTFLGHFSSDTLASMAEKGLKYA